MTISVQDLVRREVICCVSSLVHTLSQGFGSNNVGVSDQSLNKLFKQAFELSISVFGYEEAAREAGWTFKDGLFLFDGEDALSGYGEQKGQPDWEALCLEFDIEPYDREVFEHWVVTEWLADRLINKGEKVDKDLQGLCVWARTTTGHEIHRDWVIEEIAQELNEAY